MTGGDLREAVEQAMSDAFRAYTGSRRGDHMWNLDMEKTWAIVAPSVVALVENARIAEQERARQMLTLPMLAALRCIPDGEIRDRCVVSDGATVRERLRAAWLEFTADVRGRS